MVILNSILSGYIHIVNPIAIAFIIMAIIPKYQGERMGRSHMLWKLWQPALLSHNRYEFSHTDGPQGHLVGKAVGTIKKAEKGRSFPQMPALQYSILSPLRLK